MHIVVGHHQLEEQSVAMGVMDEVCIAFFESDVIVLPLELLCKPLVHTANISERSPLCLQDVPFLCPTHFSGKVRSTEDHPNLVWGLHLRCIVLQLGPSTVNVVLEVPTADEFFDLILECNTFFSGVIDVHVVSTIFILIPFGAASMQWIKPLEYSNVFCSHEDILL